MSAHQEQKQCLYVMKNVKGRRRCVCKGTVCEIQPSHSQCVRPGSARLLLRVCFIAVLKNFLGILVLTVIFLSAPLCGYMVKF